MIKNKKGIMLLPILFIVGWVLAVIFLLVLILAGSINDAVRTIFNFIEEYYLIWLIGIAVFIAYKVGLLHLLTKIFAGVFKIKI